MKKYLSLFVLLTMVFALGNVKITKAENDNEDENSSGVPTLINDASSTSEAPTLVNDISSTLVNPRIVPTPAQMRAIFEKQKLMLEEKKKELEKNNQENQDENSNDEESNDNESGDDQTSEENYLHSRYEDFKANLEARREEMKKNMESFKENIKNEKDEKKAKEQEHRVDGRENALQRFDKIVEKLTEFDDKINAQVVKFEEKNIDVTDAKILLVTGEASLSEAKIKIAEVNAIFVDSIDQISEADKATLKTLTEEIKNLVKETHTAFGEAVKLLRDAVPIRDNTSTGEVPTNINVTTTPETN